MSHGVIETPRGVDFSWIKHRAYPDKQDLCRVLLLDFQEEGVQGGLAVFGPPPLSQAVLDSQGVSHVQVLDQLLGSWLVNGLQALLPVLEGFLQRKQSMIFAMCLIHMLQCVLQGDQSKTITEPFFVNMPELPKQSCM